MIEEYRQIAEFLEGPVAVQLLAKLGDGQAHSLGDLAAALGWRIDDVSGALGLLHAAGLETAADATGRVQLPAGLELLDSAAILDACGSAARHLATVTTRLGVASTNDLLLEQAQAGAASGTACFAEWQGAGRGRRGRQWFSPFAGSIYFSLLWRFTRRAPASDLALQVGVALARCLSVLGLRDLSLKWPNDLHWRGRKLGGLLIEGGGHGGGDGYVVIGTGLNYRLPAPAAAAIDQPVATLSAAMAPRCPSRNALAGELLAALVAALRAFEHGEHEDWRRHWDRYDCTRNQRLRVSLPGGRELHGTGAGLRGDGALLVDVGDRVEAVLAGDVSVRLVR